MIEVGHTVKVDGRRYKVLKVGVVADGQRDMVLLASQHRSKGGEPDLLVLHYQEVVKLLNPVSPTPVIPAVADFICSGEVINTPLPEDGIAWAPTPPAAGSRGRYFTYPALEDAEIVREIMDPAKWEPIGTDTRAYLKRKLGR